ncbi:MAG TPA: hypothetical protein VLD39_14045 [Gammaproteobacteria bacterium]|nr:hypothetical protein [Gammaproteobacteria bacterium]
MSGSNAIAVACFVLAGLWAPAGAQTPAPPASDPAPLLTDEELGALEPGVDVGAVPAPRPPAVSPTAPVAPPAPAAAAAAGPLRAMDTLDLGTTSITGNQELPKVLYIVPWKQSDLGDLVGRPVNTLLDEVLAPIDPEEFERQLGYYDTLHEEHREE